MRENNNLKMGIRDGLPICFGYFAVSFAFGIFAVSSGLSILEAVFISAFNLTSAGQLAAVPIIAGGGSFIELALTQLVINARYALMSVSLSQRLGSTVKMRHRFLIAFANTDEIFAVSSSKEAHVGLKYMLGLIVTPFLGWTLGTLVGAAAGNILPDMVVVALQIAIYAMLIAVVVPAAKDNGKVAIAALLAIALSCVFYFVPIFKLIPSGFSIIIIAVGVSALMAIFAPLPDEKAENEEVKKNA
ncbi:MAG: AzlC family ABC transporter permease [Clostridia bacterium]|nr:AzlC family ABC transporter permease [Clostridia bacterium]